MILPMSMYCALNIWFFWLQPNVHLLFPINLLWGLMVERQPILLHCRFIMSYMDDNMLKCTFAGNINLTVQPITCQVRELKSKADTNDVFVMYYMHSYHIWTGYAPQLTYYIVMCVFFYRLSKTIWVSYYLAISSSVCFDRKCDIYQQDGYSHVT